MKPTPKTRLGAAEGANPAPGSRARKHAAGLMKKIQAERVRLSVWKEFFPIVQHIMDFELWPQQQLFDAHLRKLILLFDQAHADKRMGKRDKAKLTFLICDMAIEILNGGGEDELLEVYARHTGEDLEGDLEHDPLLSPDSMDEHHNSGADRLNGHDCVTTAQPPVENTLEDRQLAEIKRMQESAREIYRKLVSALHPDSEPDAAERQRKMSLMHRVNAAYAANDLLGLVELQAEVDQINLASLDKLSEEEVGRYNEILAGQLRQLQRENADWAFAITVEAECPYRQRQTPKSLMRSLENKLVEDRYYLAQIERDLEDFQDINNLKKWLKAYRITQANQPYVASS